MTSKLRYLYNGTNAVRPGMANRTKGGIVVPPSGFITPPSGFQTFSEDQYADGSRWNVYDNSTYGAQANNMRIQRYMSANTIFGAGSAGATNGTSMKQLVKREAIGGNDFTAGMVDSQGKNLYYPLWCYMEFRCKTPHGHGLWPAWWLTARIGGATKCEWDVFEYFHGQLPGQISCTLHGSPTSTSGLVEGRFTNNTSRISFETPTYTPQWFKWGTEILPVTDSTGNTIGDLTQPSQYVRFRVFMNGVEKYRFVDPSAMYWSSTGGTIASFWNIYIQGCQVSGKYVGHPDDPLAYSAQLGDCVNGGTAPNSCTLTHAGGTVRRAGAAGSTASFSDPATTFEQDYFYCATPIAA